MQLLIDYIYIYIYIYKSNILSLCISYIILVYIIFVSCIILLHNIYGNICALWEKVFKF